MRIKTTVELSGDIRADWLREIVDSLKNLGCTKVETDDGKIVITGDIVRIN